MNKKQLIAELEKIGMRPGRGLGQNFLLDGNLLDWIVRLAAPKPGEKILEVGPGFGALSRKLLATGAEVTAIEFDHRIAEYLRGSIADAHFHLIEDDACRVDYGKLLAPGEKFRAIANLPYSISSIFIARMLEQSEPPEEMYFMLQLEMAERLAAEPGIKSYGALSVRVQARYHVKIAKLVRPDVFYPPPAVDSAIVSFKRHLEFNDAAVLKAMDGLAKLVFSQRRKQMGKVIGNSYGKERALAALAALNIPPETRPERLGVAQFFELAGLLK